MYVYIDSEHYQGNTLWTVGFYDPSGNWHPDMDTNNRDEAARRVAFLNGGSNSDLEAKVKELETAIEGAHKLIERLTNTVSANCRRLDGLETRENKLYR